jgi:hypothetical protein
MGCFRARVVCFSVLALSQIGCARVQSSPKSPETDPSFSSSSSPSNNESLPIHDTMAEFRKGERIACAEGTDLVYVVSRDGGLHSFDPNTLAFKKIGSLHCPNTDHSLPHSMAVDRAGRAWINFDNGVIALANISDARCTASEVVPLKGLIAPTFGMGFAPTPEGGIGGETLFLSGPSDETQPAVLARVDDGKNVKIAGSYPSSFKGVRLELSSRADGKLFGFFASDPFVLAEIDPATADVRWQKPLSGMRFSRRDAGAWAFAAVGSEFFFFWADGADARFDPLDPQLATHSVVTRLREDGTLDHVVKDAGIEIVGAGASTCAARNAKIKPPPAVAEKTPPPTPLQPPQAKCNLCPPPPPCFECTPPPPQRRTPPPPRITQPRKKKPKKDFPIEKIPPMEEKRTTPPSSSPPPWLS